MKKLLVAGLSLVLVCSMLFVGCGKKEDANKIPDTIKVGTNAEFPPFEYKNDKGEYDGFDMAIMQEVCKRIGSEMKIENMEFKSLVGAMESKNLDVIAAGMTVTDERKEAVDFTDSYYTSNQYIIVKKESKVKKLSDLNGKKIGVQEGTTGDFIASGDSKTVKDATVKRYKKGADAVVALRQGGVDAVVIDANPAKEYVKNNKGLKLIKDESSKEQYAFAVQKGNEKLAKEINKQLKAIKADGTYDKLVKKYIGN